MQNVVKKVYISILTCVIVMITMVATTFAWVGILTTTSLGNFELDIQNSNIGKDYDILISSDGINFSNNVSDISIKQQILKNMGIDYESELSNPNDESSLTTYFNKKAILKPVSTSLIDNHLTDFYEMKEAKKGEMTFTKSNKFYKYDIYLSIHPKNQIQEETDIDASLVISNLSTAIKGVNCSGILANNDYFYGMNDIKYAALKDLPSYVTINSASSTRFAVSIFEPINLTDNYTNETPVNTIIYQGGTNEPSLKDGIYSFGGILPEEYNLAIREMKSIYSIKTNLYDSEFFPIGRENDYELESGNNILWQKNSSIYNNYFGIKNGILTKIKLSIYFWFEGWDADCMNFINKTNNSLELVFSADF